jgi:hypothetical protein
MAPQPHMCTIGHYYHELRGTSELLRETVDRWVRVSEPASSVLRQLKAWIEDEELEPDYERFKLGIPSLTQLKDHNRNTCVCIEVYK